jgi:SAM-dependent methyltransferase
LIRTVWRGALRRVPPKLADRVFQSWVNVTAERSDPAEALRRLFALDDHLQREIDRTAIRYDGGVHAKHRLTGYHDFFVERIRPEERVLDIGCGIGSVGHDVAERAGAVVVGIDSSPWALATARARFAHPRVSYVEADALTYEPESSFDVAILSNVLEHLAKRHELLASLRARGVSRLLVRVPALDRDWTVPLRRELELPYFSDPDHEVEYLPELLRNELRAAGWEMGGPTLAWGEIWAEATPAAG